MKNFYYPLCILALLISVGHFTACEKNKKVSPADPFKNGVALQQFCESSEFSLRQVHRLSLGAMSENDFASTVQEMFLDFQKANPALVFSAADHKRIALYLNAWSNTLTALEKTDLAANKQQVLLYMREQTEIFCLDVSENQQLTYPEKQSIVEQLTLKSGLMTASISVLMPGDVGNEEGKDGGSWFKINKTCLPGIISKMGACRDLIALIKKSSDSKTTRLFSNESLTALESVLGASR